MSDFNHEFLETADIVPAFVPVDMQTAANNGQWVNMKHISKLIAVLFKAAGTAGDNPVFTLKQATDSSGTGAKALNFTRARTKIGAIGSTPQWTVATQSAGNTYTPTSAASQALIAVEIQSSDLDTANGFGYPIYDPTAIPSAHEPGSLVAITPCGCTGWDCVDGGA